MRLFVLARHGETELNVTRRVNGDPDVLVPLTASGEAQARSLGEQLANVPLAVCVHTRFDRTRRTAAIALARRELPFVVEPLLDDVDVGTLEGETVDAYRSWKRAHTRRDQFPGGESLDDAARRYAHGFEALLARPEPIVLAVVHEIPIRYALNAAGGSNELDGPAHDIRNCVPYLFDETGLRRAIEGIHRLTSVEQRETIR
jgi:broad specificity phosphatase PhoE